MMGKKRGGWVGEEKTREVKEKGEAWYPQYILPSSMQNRGDRVAKALLAKRQGSLFFHLVAPNFPV